MITEDSTGVLLCIRGDTSYQAGAWGMLFLPVQILHLKQIMPQIFLIYGVGRAFVLWSPPPNLRPCYVYVHLTKCARACCNQCQCNISQTRLSQGLSVCTQQALTHAHPIPLPNVSTLSQLLVPFWKHLQEMGQHWNTQTL